MEVRRQHYNHPAGASAASAVGPGNAPNARAGRPRRLLAAMIIGCASLLCSSPGRAGVPDPATATTTLTEAVCGDANGDGKVTAGDALLALRAAVGSSSCSLEICDYSGDGKLTASDALAILRKAVGQDMAPNCPPGPTTPLTWDEGAWGQVSWN